MHLHSPEVLGDLPSSLERGSRRAPGERTRDIGAEIRRGRCRSGSPALHLSSSLRGQVSSAADPHTKKVEEEVDLPGKLGGLKAIAHQKVEHTGTTFP